MRSQSRKTLFGETELIDAHSIEEALDSIENASARTTVVRATFGPGMDARQLCARGFSFADRTIGASVQARTLPNGLDRLIRIRSRVKKPDKKSCFEIAKQGLSQDVRFRVSPDEGLFIGILASWIDEIDECLVCEIEGRLAGFLETEQRDNALFVKLAATDERFRLSGVALSLYASALEKAHGQSLSHLEGRVSTKNIAALNLWASLGAKFAEPNDIYIGIFDHV